MPWGLATFTHGSTAARVTVPVETSKPLLAVVQSPAGSPVLCQILNGRAPSTMNPPGLQGPELSLED